MTAVVPHYTRGPWNKQVASLVFGGQFVVPNTAVAGTTDLTVKPAVPATADAGTPALGTRYVMGLAGEDANVISTQTGVANTYGEPLIDISVLTDYTAVYSGGWDIWTWFAGPAIEGDLLVVGGAVSGATVTPGTITGSSAAAYNSTSATAITVAPANIVGRCTHPGGVSAAMLTQQIGGAGTASYFLGRVRVF